MVYSLSLISFAVSFIRLRSSASQSPLFAYAHQLRSLLYIILSRDIFVFFKVSQPQYGFFTPKFAIIKEFCKLMIPNYAINQRIFKIFDFFSWNVLVE